MKKNLYLVAFLKPLSSLKESSLVLNPADEIKIKANDDLYPRQIEYLRKKSKRFPENIEVTVKQFKYGNVNLLNVRVNGTIFPSPFIVKNISIGNYKNIINKSPIKFSAENCIILVFYNNRLSRF